MKGYYRIWVQRPGAPADWELVGSANNADEAHAKALHWEESGMIAVRVDVCVRYWHYSPVASPVDKEPKK